MSVSNSPGYWCTLVPTYQVTWRRSDNSLPLSATLTSESSLSAFPALPLSPYTCISPSFSHDPSLPPKFSHFPSSFAPFLHVTGPCLPSPLPSSFLLNNLIPLLLQFFLFFFLLFRFPITSSTPFFPLKNIGVYICIYYINSIYCTDWMFTIIKMGE